MTMSLVATTPKVDWTQHVNVSRRLRHRGLGWGVLCFAIVFSIWYSLGLFRSHPVDVVRRPFRVPRPDLPPLNSNDPDLPPTLPETSAAVQDDVFNDPFADGEKESPIYWHGWKQIEYMFVFGDSWSTTKFKVGGRQPNSGNPLGNPDMPEDGVSMPPKWVHYLTAAHNQSFVNTYNLAQGAATVERSVVPPHPAFNFTHTFREQVEDVFRLVYASHPSQAPWLSQNTLFATWFGVPDVYNLATTEEPDLSLAINITEAYADIVRELHRLGARNFLMINVPPIQIAPDAVNPFAEFALVQELNKRLFTMEQNLGRELEGVQIFLLDIYNLLVQVREDPTIFEETAGIKNTTKNCWDYNPDFYVQQKLPPLAWNEFKEECGVRLDEYFWSNHLHPTHVVQNAIARQIVDQCFQDRRGRFCF